MQKKETRRAVVLDGFHHRAISAVGDGIANAGLFTFELKPKSATRTFEIAGLGAGLEPVQFGRGTIRAIKVFRAPSLRDVTGLLRTAFKTVGKRAGHGKIHTVQANSPTNRM